MNPKLLRTKNCVICGKEFKGHVNKTTCSDECTKINNKNKLNSNLLKASLEKYPDGSDPYTYAECVVCGYRSQDISLHPKIHGMTIKEYETKYNISTKSQKVIDSMKGDKNPAFNHGGLYSPFSKKFVNYTDDKAIQDLRDKAELTKIQNNSSPKRTSYYTNKGYSEAEAIKLLSDSQATFSLALCIEKYGEVEGKARWDERQEKWLNTLDDKTDDEKREINRKKRPNIGLVSKQEQRLVDALSPHFNINQQFMLLKECGIKWYIYDIQYENKIIEYNGDVWHANPNIYSENDIPPFPNNTMTSKQLWNKDSEKVRTAINNGYKVLTIWEQDFIDNPTHTIERCIDFLKL